MVARNFLKNPLNRRIFRLMLQHPGRNIPILVLLSVIILFISSFFIVQSSVLKLYDKWYAASNVEDGRFTVPQLLSEDTASRIEREAGVTLFENHYVEVETSDNLRLGGTGDASNSVVADDENICIKIYRIREKVNIQALYDGSLPGEDAADEIAIDRCFANSRGLKIGDYIAVDGRDIRIVGFIALPDYSSLIRRSGDLLMDPRHFGVAVVSDAGFEALDLSRIGYEYSYIENVKSTDKSGEHRTQHSIAEILIDSRNYPLDMASKSQNQGISFFKDDMGGDVPVMVILLAVVVLAITFLFTVQAGALIEEEAPVIGTLRAMGLSRGALIFHYMLLPVCVTLFAAIFGNIGAYNGTYKLFKTLYYENYSLPPFEVSFDLNALLITTVLPCAIVILANFFSLYLKLSLSPLRFLRGEISNTFKKKNAVKLGKMRFINKYMIRVIMNSKGGIIAMFFGALISSLLLMFGQIILPILQGYAADLRAEAKSEYQIILKMPVEADAEKFSIAALEAEINGKKIDARLYGIVDDSAYYSGDFGALGDGEVLVASGMAERFKLKSGDVIELENPFEEKVYEVKVAGVYEGIKSMNMYTSIRVHNALMQREDEYYSGYFSDEKLDIDHSYIASIIDRSSFFRIAEQFVHSFGSVAKILMLVSVVFYFVIIYVLTKILIDRSKKEICYLRVFGFENSEISAVYLNSLGFMFAGFIVILMPILDKLVKVLVTLSFQKTDAYVTVEIPLTLHLVTVALGLAAFLAVRFIQSRKIGRANMAESLKDMTM